MTPDSSAWHAIRPQGLALAIVVTGILFFVLTTVVVATRCWIRFRANNVGLDDFSMVAGYLINVVHTSVAIRGCFTGLGSRDAVLDGAARMEGLKSLLIWQASYSAGLCFIKASISITLMRITTQKVYHYLLIGLLALCSVVSSTSIIVVLNQCHPLERYWDKAVPGSCMAPASATAMSYISSAVNVVTDICVATIPIFLLRHVQMRSQLKFYIRMLFGLGLLAGVASTVRLGFTPAYMETTDFLYYTGKVVLCTVLECGIGIIAGSLPILRTFFARLAKDYSSDTGTGYNSKFKAIHLTYGQFNTRKTTQCELDTYVNISGGENENDNNGSEDMDAKKRITITRKVIVVTTDICQTSGELDGRRIGGIVPPPKVMVAPRV
ncbi:hypothetical protein CGRA01v4_09741 [Colletotrichum graminicola]|uniref:Rhodopsin domain-containing protein n=1 Tax=Colletotrichum graminicola (strain M1.001 / M2 / FGSC 10212) TaxID=645133 RepID=E3QTG6_COLGM|nr:uncharacterized protein GLRG_09298 [Colletotrichum graminicola M1.001]EFQ34154.1 hypothetical protein GLRG_09298 [Colletotrichum graminicola M1.001]WDK18456.1 hypothetical protein CGRA01v4_09741 [Colletotrichum graminicola]